MAPDDMPRLGHVMSDLAREKRIEVFGSSKAAALAGALACGLALSACSQEESNTRADHGRAPGAPAVAETNNGLRGTGASATQMSVRLSEAETYDFVISAQGLAAFGNPDRVSVLVLDEGGGPGRPGMDGVTRLMGEVNRVAGERGLTANADASDVAGVLGGAFEAGAATVRLATRDGAGRPGHPISGVYADLDKLAADSDLIRPGIPINSRPRFRVFFGRHSDQFPATLWVG